MHFCFERKSAIMMIIFKLLSKGRLFLSGTPYFSKFTRSELKLLSFLMSMYFAGMSDMLWRRPSTGRSEAKAYRVFSVTASTRHAGIYSDRKWQNLKELETKVLCVNYICYLSTQFTNCKFIMAFIKPLYMYGD